MREDPRSRRGGCPRTLSARS